MSGSSELPKRMRAVVLTGHGGLDRLELRTDWPVPSIATGEVLVRVSACGMNNTDINTRTAWYSKAVTEGTTQAVGEHGAAAAAGEGAWGSSQIEFPRIQGADICGEVVAAGPGAPAELVGRRALVDPWLRDRDDPADVRRARFLGSEADGGYAEYVAVPAVNVHPVECELTDTELASFATAYVTAQNMLDRAAVKDGERVLVTGASGGVGSALVQLVRARGATPVAMCSDAKAGAVREIGAGAVLPRTPADLAGALEAATGQPTVDVVADVVGGEGWPALIDALAAGGRYTVAGAIAGPIVPLDLRTLYLRDLTFTGATVPAPDAFGRLVRSIESGAVRPLVSAVYPLEQLKDAQRAFLTKEHVGNIVVRVRPNAA
jgi:NADPH:quinone reductase-like Zn-dependent oxidoreductase